jgi:radical SAM protein with 4Fe4S-binding SPASM domain
MRWRLRRMSSGRPQRLLLQWHVTERCTQRCAHCYQEEPPGAELSFQELLEVLRQFKELLGPAPGHVNLTGGEPFLRADFLPLLEVLSAQRPRLSFAILTSGGLVDAAMARRLRRLGPSYVQVSIDGAQAMHDTVRGPGDFERTVAAVGRLVRAGLPTVISFTAHRMNYGDFPEVAKLGRRLGATRVWADRLIPVGRGSALETLRPEETRDLFRLMRHAREEAQRGWSRRTQVPMHRALQFLEGGRPYHCTAGDTLITVQPNGDVYPCRRMPIRVGNLLKTPLAELYRGNPLLGALRDPNRVSVGCEGCPHVALCRGGLRCLAFAVTGDPFQADPGCWLVSAAGERQAEPFRLSSV